MGFQDDFARGVDERRGGLERSDARPVRPLGNEQASHAFPSPRPVEAPLESDNYPSTGSGRTELNTPIRHPDENGDLLSSSLVEKNRQEIPDQVRNDEDGRGKERSDDDTQALPQPLPQAGGEKTSTVRHDGWTPDIRVKYLEALANCGNVQSASHYVQRSRTSAYNLKNRDADFARGWDAALLLSREVATDELQNRAINGVEEEVYYHGDVIATRRRYDSRLLLAHIARLDKLAENVAVSRAAARFGAVTDAIAAKEDTAPLIAEPTAEEIAEEEKAARTLAKLRQDHAGYAHAPEPEQDLAEPYQCIRPEFDDEPDVYVMTRAEVQKLCDDVPGMQARLLCSMDSEWITGRGGESAEAEKEDHGSVNNVNFVDRCL